MTTSCPVRIRQPDLPGGSGGWRPRPATTGNVDITVDERVRSVVKERTRMDPIPDDVYAEIDRQKQVEDRVTIQDKQEVGP